MGSGDLARGLAFADRKSAWGRGIGDQGPGVNRAMQLSGGVTVTSLVTVTFRVTVTLSRGSCVCILLVAESHTQMLTQAINERFPCRGMKLANVSRETFAW